MFGWYYSERMICYDFNREHVNNVQIWLPKCLYPTIHVPSTRFAPTSDNISWDVWRVAIARVTAITNYTLERAVHAIPACNYGNSPSGQNLWYLETRFSSTETA